jgi:hypothetical protein
VIAAFRPHLPSRFSLSTGIVVDSSGNESRQQDIIIADTLTAPPFLLAGHIGFFPVELVAGSIQVKSRVDPSELPDAVENITSFKRLVPRLQRSYAIATEEGDVRPESFQHRAFGGIFAFDAPAGSGSGLPEAFMDACLAVPPRERPDALVVLDRYAVSWGLTPQPGEGPTIATSTPEAGCCLSIEAGHDTLLFFYLTLMQHLRAYVAPPIDYGKYLQASQFDFQWKAFRPGG